MMCMKLYSNDDEWFKTLTVSEKRRLKFFKLRSLLHQNTDKGDKETL